MRISPQSKASKPEAMKVAKRRFNFAAVTKNRDTTAYIGLVGGNDPAASAVRHAQSFMRLDRRPAYFSDCFVCRPRKDDETVLWAPIIGADPRRPERFGIRTASLEDFASVKQYPNIAVIAVTPVDPPQPESGEIALTAGTAAARMKRFRRAFENPTQLAELRQLWTLVSAWQPHVFEPDRVGNPLHDGISHPGTVLARWLLSTLGVEGAPGATEDADAPEHLWAFAKWWGESALDVSVSATVRHCRNITDPGCSVADVAAS